MMVILQTPGMKEFMLKKANTLQTNIIMGFVKDERMPSLNVTCTGTFYNILEHYIPVMIGVLFGMTRTHYQRYIYTLIDCHKTVNFEDFKCFWPGNVCGFSDSEQVGLGNSVGGVFHVDDKDDLKLSALFGACEILFDYSCAIVAKNHSVMPAQSKIEFDEMVKSLLDLTIDEETLNSHAESIYQRDSFPKATKWTCIQTVVQ